MARSSQPTVTVASGSWLEPGGLASQSNLMQYHFQPDQTRDFYKRQGYTWLILATSSLVRRCWLSSSSSHSQLQATRLAPASLEQILAKLGLASLADLSYF